jgi:amidophosphoribosyltransferase
VHDEGPRESCGLYGVYGVHPASPVIHSGLLSLQHRGQEGAGIVTSDGTSLRVAKAQGLVNEVFARQDWGELPGSLGIGHVRYSTTGSSRAENVQPLVAECVDGLWAVAHNGNLVNAARLRRMYQEAGAIFQTTTDSEVLVHLLADPLYRSRPRRVERVLAELRGAFSLLIMTREAVMAARDPWGIRPLCIGRLGEGHVFASESCALAQTGAAYVRDVLPGELVTVDGAGLRSSMFVEPGEHPKAHCVFELVYFARPDSTLFGRNVHQVRCEYGRSLAREHPASADVVIPVPDSGNSAALGYSRESGIPLDYGFIRNHYVGRTFIMPSSGAREAGVDMKLAVLPEVVRGKRVVLVDDSIVRGTTMRGRVARLREAGAREVHVRISCPPTAHPCHYGIDFPTRDELVAGSRDAEAVRQLVGADSLGYLSVEGLLSPFPNPLDFCTACFTGEYRVDPGEGTGKLGLEGNRPEVRLT